MSEGATIGNRESSSSSVALNTICQWLEQLAPLPLAEEWDNVGLLIGDRAASVQRVMTCLTPTPESVAEAIKERAELIIAHHPLPFKAVKRITTDTVSGRMLWDLARAGIALYSPHTAFDSAGQGINQRIAEGLGLSEIRPLRPIAAASSDTIGTGRVGIYASPQPIEAWLNRVAKFFQVTGLHAVIAERLAVKKVAVACGAAGEFLSDAARVGCDAFVTGELRFHSALEAKSLNVHVAVPGHHATERFAVEQLAVELSQSFPALQIWASKQESDPLVWREV